MLPAARGNLFHWSKNFPKINSTLVDFAATSFDAYTEGEEIINEIPEYL